ncbi:MAG: M1 family metallopeptidase [Bacteroidota bacterium]
MHFSTLLLCWLLILPLLAMAQADYFQQEVNYTIKVTLDDQEHRLDGTIDIEYHNKSPQALNEIYMHLWANAFKDRTTAFSRQKLRTGSTRFFFAKDSTLGNFSDLEFTVDGTAANWSFYDKNPDIALIQLNKPLAPGEKIQISTPLKLKIPASFSRLGHVGESYQMTQWYPKPAVYDKDGWHPMPYLDLGEFYSEFGDFDVTITLPDNYVVAATGVLQTESEKAFLAEKVKASASIDTLSEADNKFPPSSSTNKTIRYVAENVHDFAWFADKRFYVRKSEVQLASGRKVDTWAYYTNEESNLWEKGTFYVDRAVEFYSEKVGEYPYPHATAVQSALSAGGGMEYPMITVIGLSGNAQALDAVITHEVGHNWFYGILAFDERDHAWLDEGINSYYDHRYTAIYYTKNIPLDIPGIITNGSDEDILNLAYLFQARRAKDQAPSLTSDDFVPINYFLSAYEKPARIFRHLEKYLGTAEFDRIMQGFYERWKFKHPQPEDLESYLEKESGKDLSWLFDDLIGSDKQLDYQLKTWSNDPENYQLEVVNKGEIAAPFPIAAIKNETVVHLQWYEGFSGSQTLTFPKGDYDWLVIDPEKDILDIDRSNNNLRFSGMLKRLEPLRFKFLLGMEHSRKTSLYFSPLVAFNGNDKVMPGLVLYNRTIPTRKLEFAFAPMFGTKSQTLTGLGHIHYNIYPAANTLQRIRLGLTARRFSHEFNEGFDYHLTYNRLNPFLEIELGKKKETSNFTQNIRLDGLFISEESAEFTSDTIDGVQYIGNNTTNPRLFRLRYSGEMRRALNPFSYFIQLEQMEFEGDFIDQDYLKLSFEWKSSYTYGRGRSIDVRFFFGRFLSNSRQNAGAVADRALARGSFALSYQGFNDMTYDELFLDRSENAGLLSRQVSMQEGGMKYALTSVNKGTIGHSNRQIIAINLKADLPQDLPFNLPLKPYLDLGYFDDQQPINSDRTFEEQLLVSGGVMLEWFNGALGIYFPIVNSSNLKDQYSRFEDGNYLPRITYSIDFHRANPWQILERLQF